MSWKRMSRGLAPCWRPTMPALSLIHIFGHTLIGNNALWLASTLYMFLRGVLQYFMTHSLRTIYRKAGA